MVFRFSLALMFVACGEKTIDETDEEVTVTDADGDGIEASLDCDDSSADFGAIEADTDCDGFLNEDDCEPEDAEINPDVEDEWYDGVDSNCDGADDYDQDGDGEASADHDGTDCDDTNADINTNAEDEWYDGVDSNCDRLSDYDQDGDGEDALDHGGTDCDDLDSSINSGTEEVWYDGIDQNCDGLSDYDQDVDGVDALDHGGLDCDDTNSSTIGDDDGDGYYSCVDDCDDTNASVFPSAPEFCDAVDWDCNGLDYEPGYVTTAAGTNYTIFMDTLTTPNDNVYINTTTQLDVCEGTYSINLMVDESVDIIGHGNAVLDGGSSTKPIMEMFIAQAGVTNLSVNIDGITFQNGTNSLSIQTDQDGGYLLDPDGSYQYTAGGIDCQGDYFPTASYTEQIVLTVSNSEFLNNSGEFGGAITTFRCPLTIENTVFENNQATFGGAIAPREETTVLNSSFTNNSASSGGAVFLNGRSWLPSFTYGLLDRDYFPRENAHFENVDFDGNTVTNLGGAIYSVNASAYIESSTVVNNTAGYGGGIYTRDSQFTVTDSMVSTNTADYGGGIRMYETTDSVSSNVFYCSDEVGPTTITGNTTNNSVGATYITGDNAYFIARDCIMGGNVNGNLTLSEGGGPYATLSSTGGQNGVMTQDEWYTLEVCDDPTIDNNGNGLYGWEDPYCSVMNGVVYDSYNLWEDNFVPDASCSTLAVYQDNDAVLSVGEMDWTGCVSAQVNVNNPTSYSLTLFDGQGVFDTCIEETFSSSSALQETYVKGEDPFVGVAIETGSQSELAISQVVDYGYDCDGNCCYDIYMSDSYGDGWTGGVLNVFQGLTIIDTVTLDDGYDGWDSFCVDSAATFFLTWDDTNQGYNDTETFVLMQGDSSTGNTVCDMTNDLSSGIVTDCGTSGGMTCQ